MPAPGPGFVSLLRGWDPLQKGYVHAARQVLASGGAGVDRDDWRSKRPGWAEVASPKLPCQGCFCIILTCPARRVIRSAVSHGASIACLVSGDRIGMKL